MKDLNAKEMLQLVKELTNKHHITAYEIGEKTELNTSGVHRILSGEVPSPRIKTLKTILTYIENKIMGTSRQKETREAKEAALDLNDLSIEKRIALEVLKTLEPKLQEFKNYHNGIMRALASQALDLEDFRDLIEKIKKDPKNKD